MVDKRKCWEILKCNQVACPSYGGEDKCWFLSNTRCHGGIQEKLLDKLDMCLACRVFRETADQGSMAEVLRLLNEQFKEFKHCVKARERVAEQAVKASQTELRLSEEKYKTLFDSTPNSIFLLDPESFKILDVNARGPEIYGFRRDEMVGQPFFGLGTDRYPNGILSMEEEGTQSLSSYYQKVQHRKKDGTPFYVDVFVRKSPRSSKYGVVAVTVDITERLATESQLLQTSKMSTLGEMASGIAHELNQPLSAIQIGTDFLSETVETHPEGWKDLLVVSKNMTEQVERAIHIINHLRKFGRRTDITKTLVDINTPIKGVFTLLGQQLRVRNIEVVLDLAENLPPIMGDTNRLEQVFINLVVNARNAMEEKRATTLGEAENILTVRSFLEGERVAVTIRDTGTGIPEAVRDKIFEPFFTTKEVGKGTGLGLSISYGIVKDYNGTIEVESEWDQGSAFKITFPASEGTKNGS